MECLQRIELLAGSDEPDRCACHLLDGEGCAAARVGVELCEDDAVDGQALVKRLGGVDGVLTDHGVHDEEDLVRIDRAADRAELGHQLVVDVQAAGRVEH